MQIPIPTSSALTNRTREALEQRESNGERFDLFYAFPGGETDRWQPAVFQNNAWVQTPGTHGYHSSSTPMIAFIRSR